MAVPKSKPAQVKDTGAKFSASDLAELTETAALASAALTHRPVAQGNRKNARRLQQRVDEITSKAEGKAKPESESEPKAAKPKAAKPKAAKPDSKPTKTPLKEAKMAGKASVRAEKQPKKQKPKDAPKGPAQPPPTKAQISSSTLFIRNLSFSTTNKDLEDFFGELGPIKWAFVVANPKNPSENRGFGYVQYVILEDAVTARKELDSKELNGRKLFVRFSKDKDGASGESSSDGASATSAKSAKPMKLADAVAAPAASVKISKLNKKVKKILENATRLIVRNLSFDTTEAELHGVFGMLSAAPVLDINFPLKPDGSSRGFAFVSFKSHEDAAAAMKVVNGHRLHTRALAVDFSLPKDDYELVKSVTAQKDAPASDSESEEEEEEEEGADSDADSEAEAGSDSEADDDDVDQDTASDEDDEDNAPKTSKASDVDEGRTVFVRNVSFESTQEDVQTALANFGKIAFCLLVKDRATGRSRGTAFVKFAHADSARACLAESEAMRAAEAAGSTKAAAKAKKPTFSSIIPTSAATKSHLYVGGRLLDVVEAVDRSQATALTNEGLVQKTRKLDTRNLYLSREGEIDLQSPAGKQLSAGDQAKRARAQAERRAKLKSPNMFVSKTRLLVRNIPLQWKDAELRSALVAGVQKRREQYAVAPATQDEAQQEGKKPAARTVNASYPKDELEGVTRPLVAPVIRQCKIVRERAGSGGRPDPNDSSLGRSAGYGFAEFATHGDALAALRALNNHPTAFGPGSKSRRPIVEFAIEDVRVLKARTARVERSGDRSRAIASGQLDPEAERREREEARLRAKEAKKAESQAPGGRKRKAPSAAGGDAGRAGGAKRQRHDGPSSSADGGSRPQRKFQKAMRPSKK
ncbi:hypothetical protein H696_05220 [Fonticula alba]|uniref:RRM domain-containing protein n=1 Tax=Fonticula alba TaxID=691883 RepID=A0A058Z2D6_FONAL|nr:hypothetical protein H696_05220 [Fonticula alba]KCV68301.1 hypothetical protein H696_05220 [Fonticula alba]|eukprot:XP_009497355.1 hypothetical protein H696_05220 [Fonticula alba]